MSDSGITREEAEAMGLIDHDEEARRHAAAVEELTRLRNEHEASSPASPSGNRHDGVRVYLTPDALDLIRHPEAEHNEREYRVRPVDIDAARTAVIEAARGVRASIDDDEDGQIAAFCRLDEAFANLDALTTKGATNG